MDPCLGKGKCAIGRIPCTCIECINTLTKPWVHGVSPIEQPRDAKVEIVKQMKNALRKCTKCLYNLLE
eukprot:15351053-Ditylum_brightwellii.AAC.1